MHPAVRVHDTQRGQQVGGDLGGAVRAQRTVGQQCGKRSAGDPFAHYPQPAVLDEDVEDLVEPGVVRELRRGDRGLHRPAYHEVGGAAGGPAPVGSVGCAPAVRDIRTVRARRTARTVTAGAGPVAVLDDLRLDDLGQRHLADVDFLAAGGVPGQGPGQVAGVGGRRGQAVATGQQPPPIPRVLLHDTSPTVRGTANPVPAPPRCGRRSASFTIRPGTLHVTALRPSRRGGGRVSPRTPSRGCAVRAGPPAGLPDGCPRRVSGTVRPGGAGHAAHGHAAHGLRGAVPRGRQSGLNVLNAVFRSVSHSLSCQASASQVMRMA